jgi:septum site-determining protein MinD
MALTNCSSIAHPLYKEVIMGKVVLVESQKNSIGKTIICIKSGIALTENGKKVLLMDLSSGKKKISEYLNVNEAIIYDIKDALDETCSLDQAVIEINENLSLLPCPRIADKLKDITLVAFTKLINEAKKTYDIIIADIDKISSSYINFSIISNIVTVNNNDFSCIKEINRNKYIAQKFNVDLISAVLNRYNRKNAKKGTAMNAKDIHKLTEIDMDVIIEENSKYLNADYDFLFDREDNSFNKAVKIIVEKINLTIFL